MSVIQFDFVDACTSNFELLIESTNMPTYAVSAVAGRFNADEKLRIAQAITRSHNEATGAQGFFAQVIFNEIPAGNHFVGGSLLQAEQIFVHGHIRAGRPDDRKKLLLSRIVDAVMEIASVERRFVWAYVSEIPPLQMIEYGHELPQPGQEDRWLESLPQADRDYLLSLG